MPSAIMYQRRHIRSVIQLVRLAKPYMSPEGYAWWLERWADEIAATNPRFERSWFVEDCQAAVYVERGTTYQRVRADESDDEELRHEREEGGIDWHQGRKGHD